MARTIGLVFRQAQGLEETAQTEMLSESVEAASRREEVNRAESAKQKPKPRERK